MPDYLELLNMITLNDPENAHEFAIKFVNNTENIEHAPLLEPDKVRLS